MNVFKIWGSDYYDQLRDKEFPLNVQRKMLDESERVSNDVEAQLAKPATDNPVVVSKIQKTFLTQIEITAQANNMRANHHNKIQGRKNGRV
jgi:hypothetical protein